MNRKEQRRSVVLNQVEGGKMSGREVTEVLDLSPCHVRRLLPAYRKKGAAALPHGNRGRKHHHVLDENRLTGEPRLAGSAYAGCNNQPATELLAEQRI